MLLLSVGYSKHNNGLYEKFKELCDYLKTKGVKIGISESDVGGMHYLKCILRDSEKDLANFESHREIFYSYSASILYSFLALEYESDLVDRLLRENYQYLEPEDFSEIRKRCQAVISGNGVFTTQGLMFNIGRRNNILRKIDEFLNESSEMILDGFVTFRLKDVNVELEQVIEKVSEDYAMEKEYSEFIKLLKYFVEIQDSKYIEINIFLLSEADFRIEDKNGLNVTDEFFEDFATDNLEGQISRHDMLISALITNAPQKIIVHGNKASIEALSELLDTVRSIFSEKMELCDGCKLCDKVLKENGKM